jgi:DNA (cytosine-5)-methyltransferase 1
MAAGYFWGKTMNSTETTTESLNELALFAGAGGGILGGKLLGWRTVCAVEWEPYAASVLVARQNDGILPPFPIWDDVQTFDGKPWRGRVDVVSGGFPCQDISSAGSGAGIDGARSGLWVEMARIIREVGPRFVFVENSPMLTSRGLGRVLGDLAAMGYDAAWGVLGAVHAGAPHKRERIWIVADASRFGRGQGDSDARGRSAGTGPRSKQGSRHDDKALADTNGLRELQPQGFEQNIGRWFGDGGASLSDAWSERGQLSVKRDIPAIKQPWGNSEARSSSGIVGQWWATEPDVGRVANGMAARVDRLRCIGNGQVPAVVRLAWRTLTNNLAQYT